MVSDVDKRKIKQIVIDTIDEFSEDISNIYLVESTGDLFCRYKVARSDFKEDAIGLQMITKTRAGVAITIKSKLHANIPELYENLQRALIKKLKEIKFNLYNFKLKVIDVE